MIRNLAFCVGFMFLTVASAPAQVMTDTGMVAPQPVMQQGAPMQGGNGPACGESYFNAGDQCGTDSCGQCMDCCSYIKLFGGWTNLEDFETFNQQVAVTGTFDDGFGGGIALGRKIRPMLNVEAEFTYRHNDADTLTAEFFNTAPVITTWDGEINSYSGMTNLIVEGCRSACSINPYAGAGAGFAFVDAGISSQFGDYSIDDSAFAYQFIAGVSRAIRCNVDAFVEYRYFACEDLHVQNRAGTVVDDFDYRTHNVFGGIRICR